MADHCPHLHEPTEDGWNRLRDPLKWSCDSCHSTDGIWCCLSCGHIGCGRRAHLPALGGGHSKHHFHTTHGTDESESTTTLSSSDGNKKRVKLLKKLRGPTKRSVSVCHDVAEDDENAPAGHEVCIDIVSKAVHCYACDDYVLSDAPWLAHLRSELNEIELRRDAMETSSSDQSEEKGFTDADYEMIDVDEDTDLSPADAKIDQRKRGAKVDTSSDDYEPGMTGLDNLGNTCYMNSVLQMLSHCSGFSSFFRDYLRAAAPLRLAGEGGYKITRQTTMRLKDALHQTQSPDKLVLTEATHALLRVLWSGKWKSISPRYFVNAVWKHSLLFRARKQQDANEFLNFYLGRVDDELKPKDATTSVMMDLFGLDQYQEVQCDECKTVTKRTEPLLGLVLSLPDDPNNEKPDQEACMADADDENDIHLINCFKSLRSTGRFVGENQFYCDACQAKNDADWRVTLQRRPQSLLISLRRTLWNKEKGLHKDKRMVKFPLELDASDILEIGKEKILDADFEGCHYKLVAVVSHSGSSPFVGHYICYARNGDNWFLFNDSSVTPAMESSVLDVEAFILLYERRGIPSVNDQI